jgi:chemotaxis protein MotB
MGKLASLLIVTVALGGGGYAGLYGYRLNQSRVNALASADARGRELTECRSDLAVEKTAKEQSQKVATDASTTLAASSTELEALRKQRAEADKRLAAFKEITEKFRKMIDSGKLTVIHRNGRMVVKLPAGVLFASGSAEISNEGRAALADVATILKQFPDRRFMVAGHTDNVPLVTSPFKNNWELSTARAVTVTTQLISAGMKPDRLAAAGYGEYEPVRANNTDAGRHENRRIEIVLLPNLAELPPIADTKD